MIYLNEYSILIPEVSLANPNHQRLFYSLTRFQILELTIQEYRCLYSINIIFEQYYPLYVTHTVTSLGFAGEPASF